VEQKSIPNSLKKYRRLSGYSQKKVAIKLGYKQTSCLSRWEKGYTMPKARELFRLSMLYKTVPNHLYFELWRQLSQEFSNEENNPHGSNEEITS
jgi:transcriptional regulator with XRE-family HTH domain